MKKIVITGPIGAGKSLFAQEASSYFTKKGYAVYTLELDEIGKQILEDENVQKRLSDAFGQEVLVGASAKSVDKEVLAQRAFASDEAAKRLNEVTHNAIAHKVEDELQCIQEQGDTAVVLIETPFPVEYLRTTPFAEQVSDACVVVIKAPYEKRMERCQHRISNAAQRDERQRSYGAFDGDIIIQNDTSADEFLYAIQETLAHEMEECL